VLFGAFFSVSSCSKSSHPFLLAIFIKILYMYLEGKGRRNGSAVARKNLRE
jgi:hypothetical protein